MGIGDKEMMTSNHTQCKEISVSQLPSTCAMRVRFENWVSDTNKSKVYVIAARNLLGQWKAYIGYPSLSDVQYSLKNNPLVQYHCDNIHSPKNVLAYGDVLDKQSAEILFPEWKERSYLE